VHNDSVVAWIATMIKEFFCLLFMQLSDDSISGFQFRYDIDTIFWKYHDINIYIDILKMIRYM